MPTTLTSALLTLLSLHPLRTPTNTGGHVTYGSTMICLDFTNKETSDIRGPKVHSSVCVNAITNEVLGQLQDRMGHHICSVTGVVDVEHNCASLVVCGQPKIPSCTDQ